MLRSSAGDGQGLLFGPESSPAPTTAAPEPPAPLALTLWRPWTWAILELPLPWAKRIENRPWDPPRWILNRWIFLHAGLTYDQEGAEWMRSAQMPPHLSPPGKMDAQGIVGAMRVTGAIYSVPGQTDPSGWLACPKDRDHGYGWIIADVYRLPVPVPCRGFQKLWPVRPQAVAAAAVAQLPAAIREQLVLR